MRTRFTNATLLIMLVALLASSLPAHGQEKPKPPRPDAEGFFQELSRGSHVQIRLARIKVLD